MTGDGRVSLRPHGPDDAPVRRKGCHEITESICRFYKILVRDVLGVIAFFAGSIGPTISRENELDLIVL